MTYRSQFLIGATRSGSGKTLLTVGILAALARRGIKIQPFKCGPDFIDPTLHQLVTGQPSINLDLYMMGKHACLEAYGRYAVDAEAVVVEGVMGLFDGGAASSAALAESLNMPVLLVVDVRSAAESVAAVIKGFEVYNPHVAICGVICNRIGSDRHRALIEEAVSHSCSSEILGFFPRDTSFELPSRHLGLHMGHELVNSFHLNDLAQAVEEHINLDSLLEKTLQWAVSSKSPAPPSKITRRRIAVAQDNAFCFYYRENLDILTDNGFELVPFSPLTDVQLPPDISLVYLGGGYPELFARELSENLAMRTALLEYARDGGRVYGECGGFMYMNKALITAEQKTYAMCGIYDAVVQMRNRLSRLGYRQGKLAADCWLGARGDVVRGHEFHYSDIVERDTCCQELFVTDQAGLQGYCKGNALGSYIHLHFAQTLHLVTAMAN